MGIIAGQDYLLGHEHVNNMYGDRHKDNWKKLAFIVGLSILAGIKLTSEDKIANYVRKQLSKKEQIEFVKESPIENIVEIP